MVLKMCSMLLVVVVVVLLFCTLDHLLSIPPLRRVLFNLRCRKLWSGRKTECRDPSSIHGVHERGATLFPRTGAAMLGVS